MESALIERLFLNQIWFAPLSVALVFTAGYFLAMYDAQLYRPHGEKAVERQIGSPRIRALQALVSFRFLGTLTVLSVSTIVVWLLLVQRGRREDVFMFLMGGLILVEGSEGLQHYRNIRFFHYAQKDESLRGKFEHSSRLVLTLSFVELYSFAVLYGLLFFMTTHWFFLGGALTCFIAGRRRRDWIMVRKAG